MRAVRLDGADAQVQLLADLGVRVAEGDQPQHLDLALAEVVRRAGRRRRLGRQPRAQPRVQIGVAPRRGADGLDELVVGGLLEDVAERPRAQRLARERRVVLHRQDDDRGARRALQEPRDRGQARLAGHVEVQHEDRRAVRADVAHRVGDVARLGDDLEVVLALEHEAQPAAHDDVVVGEDDPDACLFARSRRSTITDETAQPATARTTGSLDGGRKARTTVPPALTRFDAEGPVDEVDALAHAHVARILRVAHRRCRSSLSVPRCRPRRR